MRQAGLKEKSEKQGGDRRQEEGRSRAGTQQKQTRGNGLPMGCGETSGISATSLAGTGREVGLGHG